MRAHLAAVIIACLSFAPIAWAQQPSPPAKIADAAWLQGYWDGEGMGGSVEEFEGSLRFVAKHFHPDWVGWEEKDKALRLRLTRISDTELAFGGVVFKREGGDALVVEIAMRGKEGAAARVEVLRFKRRAL